ncbi:hypothetical protein SCHPADRAFT_931318 [Schizopora paradoxa]|uniref:MYND-type domain-containing protein n=1 Tax=Schizopora paradoxa TaxID=27342 RepID=A0A0H2RBC6_9AGAM|nr:hypothetical protein SCHPADRAFT_931318 [Schizopora paradoxa]
MSTSQCKVCGKAATDDSPMKRCSCKSEDALYCGAECQNADWKKHKKTCRDLRKADATNRAAEETATSPSTVPSVVKAVDLTGGYNIPFHPIDVEISSNHEIFNGAGHLSPLSILVGQPILVYRHLRDDPYDYECHPQREELDNLSVTHMMINPKSGFAPARWQCGIGRVTIAREDKSPLSKKDLEKIWMYCDAVIESFSNDCVPPLGTHNPTTFERFARNYDANEEFDFFDEDEE